jgi:dihydrofolate synthase / folylpolyglutamate synthase
MDRLSKLRLFDLPKYGRSNLSIVKSFYSYVGSPADSFKSIHVTGSNGKGTVWHKLARILTLSGFKTGLFISPHLLKFNERISIDGDMISDSDLSRLENDLLKKMIKFNLVKPKEWSGNLVIFDILTMMALKYFQENKVDYAVIEVGIGGRLDSTNVISPELSVITAINLEHTEILGNNLEEISEEKWGIWKSNTPVVIGIDWPQSHMVNFLKTEKGFTDDLIHWIEEVKDLNDFDIENNLIIKKSIEVLNKTSHICDEELVEDVCTQQLKGRLEKIKDGLFYDTGHNPKAIHKSISTLMGRLKKDEQLVVIWGFTREKDVQKNILVILDHPEKDRIGWIILAHSEEEDSEMSKYLPCWVKVPKMIEHLKDLEEWDKIKVLETTNKDISNEYLTPIYKISSSSIISPFIPNILSHLTTTNSSHPILIIGTFRLYSSISNISL